MEPGEIAPDGTLTVRELLEATCTDGFLVLHQGQVVAERYFNGLRPDVPHLLMSVSKSITGLVAGALACTGRLDVTRRVETIVPELKGTSFAGATVQDLLDMRAGTRDQRHTARRGTGRPPGAQARNGSRAPGHRTRMVRRHGPGRGRRP